MADFKELDRRQMSRVKAICKLEGANILRDGGWRKGQGNAYHYELVCFLGLEF
jgi:hypothetical protein